MFLQSMREKTQSIFAYIIVAVLILSFALWGISSYFGGGSDTNTVAKVNGRKITYAQFMQAYNQYAQSQQMELGANYNPSVVEQNQFKQVVLNSMIAHVAIDQYVNDLGFAIAKDQLDAVLFAIPAFQDKEAFSPYLFKRFLASRGLSAIQFLSDFSVDLAINQWQQGISRTAFLTQLQLDRAASLLNQKRGIQYVILKPENHTEKPIKQSDIQQYYTEHKADFYSQDQVDLSYVELSLEAVKKTIKPSDLELKQYYQMHQARFSSSYDKLVVRDAYVNEKAISRYASLLEKITGIAYEQPDSLAAVSKEADAPVHSLLHIERSGAASGMGADPKVIAAAFSDDVLLGKNNSEVIKLDDSHAIVLRVQAFKPSGQLPFNEVAPQIRELLKQQAISDEVEAQATKLKAALLSLDPPHVAWQIADIGRFSKLPDDGILQAAFSLPKGGVDVVALGEGNYAVVRVNEIMPGSWSKLSHKDRKMMSGMLQTEWAQVESALYTSAVIASAKVKRNVTQ